MVLSRLVVAVFPVVHAWHNHHVGTSGVMKLEDWTTIEIPGFWHVDGYFVNVTTYKSPEIKLKTGEAHFAFNQFNDMPFPSGDHSIVRADWDLVDSAGNQVGLNEVYNHHWLIGTTKGVNPLLACEEDLFFGAGAEMRGMPTVLPKGYGIRRVKATGHCGANLHFIRTDGLKTKWDGMNDPSQYPEDMQMGAAVKNCIECGYAPGRAVGICGEANDGDFNCCFTASRCPAVGGILNRSKKSYHLTYEIQWTTNLTAVKPLQGGVIDVSDGQVEWNVGPNLTNPEANQICSETLCNISQTYTVDKLPDFGGTGICSGKMLWSYMHQHNGAKNGTIKVNGKHICTSFPRHGTDPDNTPGNELGFVVGFDLCIDEDNKGNGLRLEKGDQVYLEALYDVDVHSNVSYPMPGGKHGGIMALFFFSMDCDDGSYETSYICGDGQCIEAGSKKGDFKTIEDCSANCGSALV